MRRDVTTCHSRDQYAGINGGIRDVQWSPTDAVEFAFGTDNGTIQRWDFRYNKGPKQKITAHDQRMCTSIDWHPDGKHLLSAGVDRTVKVWDFSVTGRRQKAAWVLNTPYAVYGAKWRPPYWSDETHENGAYQCTQLATSYNSEHPVIHVWDFRRPFLPFREINRFSTAPSDMLWHSRDTLWTVGKEGVFQQNDVHHAPKTVDRRNLQALAISPNGEIGGVAQQRPRRWPSRGLAYTDDTYGNGSRDRHNNNEMSRLQSSADDSLDNSFLISTMKHHHGRTASNRSAKSFSSTPPSDTAPKVMFLTRSLATNSESAKPDQVAFRGMLPGAPNPQVFAYLAQKYKAISLSDPLDLDSFLHLDRVFEQNAEYAQRAALHRLAQSWRVVGTSISIATRRRAELHRKRRILRSQVQSLDQTDEPNHSSKNVGLSQNRLSNTPNIAVRAILGTLDKPRASSPADWASSTRESTSNLATPLARPQTADVGRPDLLDIEQEHIDQLPPAVTGPKLGTQTLLDANRTLGPAHPNFNGPQWIQSADGLDERRALVGSYRASPRIPLSLTPRESLDATNNAPLPLQRHDSGESFTMFSASTDSQRGNSMPSSFASEDSRPRSEASRSGDWQTDREPSSFGKPRTNPARGEPPGLSTSFPVSPNTIPVDRGAVDIMHLQHDYRLHSAHDKQDSMVEFASGERAVQQMEHLRRNNQLLRHDSSESEAYASTSTSISDYNADMEASGTIVPEIHESSRSLSGMKSSALYQHIGEKTALLPDPASEHGCILSDFQALHVDAEEGSAYSVIGLLDNLLFYHTSKSDAQFSSFLLLLLAPLLPQTHSQVDAPGIDVAEVLNTFTETFTSLGLTPTQAKAILSTQLSQLIATGINPYQAEAILQTYHAQLHSLSLFNSAAELRRLAYPTYPAVYDQALKETQLGLLCLSCKSPINNPKDKMRCESCRRAQAPCPICWGKYPAFEPSTTKKAKPKFRSSITDRGHRKKRSSIMSDHAPDVHSVEQADSPAVPTEWSPPITTLWTWCPLCGHGGHTHCLSAWFADSTLSDGACPTEGCLCDCVQGKRRDTKIEDVLRVKAEKERSKVVRRGDDWKVNESRAVSAVRSAALDTAPDQQDPRAIGRKDDLKRVRAVAPDSDSPASGTFFGPSQGSAGSTFGKAPKY